MRPPATFVDYVYTLKIRHVFFFDVQPANQPIITWVALCQNILDKYGLKDFSGG